MPDEATTPDPAPAWPPMRFVGWSVDRVDGSSSFGTFDRHETADEWCERLRGYGNDVHVVRYEVPDEMAVLSGRLRGMARRVGKHRAAFKTLRQHMIRVGGKIEQERDEARAELARVRPVVDAARAWKVKRDQLGYPRPWSPAPDGSSIPEARALYDAMAGLDVPATPTLAGVHDPWKDGFDTGWRAAELTRQALAERAVPATPTPAAEPEAPAVPRPRVLTEQEGGPPNERYPDPADPDFGPGCGRPDCPCQADSKPCAEFQGTSETGRYCPRCGWAEHRHGEAAAEPTETKEADRDQLCP